jgi:hypothetical protein
MYSLGSYWRIRDKKNSRHHSSVKQVVVQSCDKSKKLGARKRAQKDLEMKSDLILVSNPKSMSHSYIREIEAQIVFDREV